MSAAPDGSWLSDPEQPETFFHNALKAGDTKAVEARLMRLAVVDVRRAERLYEDLKMAVHIVGGGGFAVRLVPTGEPR